MKEKILIIDDDKVIRSCLGELLELQEFNVISAEDGLIGLQLTKEQHPALIVCDIHMPNLDGYGVLQQLREDSTTANIPFIFLTSLESWESRSQASELGANDYLVKPVCLRKLLATINTQLHVKK